MKRIFTHLEGVFKTSGVVLSSISLCFLMLFMGWVGFSSEAIAQPLSPSHHTFMGAWGKGAEKMNDDTVGDKARRGLNNVFGSGTSDRVEGAAKETMGKVKGRVNADAYERDGLPTSAEKEAKSNAYRIQEPAEKLADDLKDVADQTGDSVRGFFNNK